MTNRPSLAQQAFELRRLFEGSGELRSMRLRWRMRIQPTPASRVYDIEITHRTGYHPDVRVLDPPLAANAASVLPHFYPDSRTLCLFEAGEWTSRQFLAHTIVPWTAEWLLQYEVWQVTGRWHGSGDDMAWAKPTQHAS